MNAQTEPKAKARQAQQTKALAPIDRLKHILGTASVQEQFENALRENRGQFIASLIDIYGTDKGLQECDPKRVVMEALKAATLKLPINRALGFAWIIARKLRGVSVPQFQIGYKGYIQLAQRTGQYRCINADVVYEGETWRTDRLTGEPEFGGEPKSQEVVGYFAHIETVNGFRKTEFWTKEKALKHAKRYSPSFALKDSAWQTHPDAMALKTVIAHLLSHYGVLSVEMMNVIASDEGEEEDFAAERAANANGETIDAVTRDADESDETGAQAAEAEPQEAPPKVPGRPLPQKPGQEPSW